MLLLPDFSWVPQKAVHKTKAHVRGVLQEHDVLGQERGEQRGAVHAFLMGPDCVVGKGRSPCPSAVLFMRQRCSRGDTERAPMASPEADAEPWSRDGKQVRAWQTGCLRGGCSKKQVRQEELK